MTENSLADRAIDAIEQGFADALKDRFQKCASDEGTFVDHFGNAIDQLARCRTLALNLVSKKLT